PRSPVPSDLGRFGASARAGIVVIIVLDPAALDATAPGAGRFGPRLDEVAEADEVTADPPLDDAEGVRGLLHEPLRLDVELDLDDRPIRPDRAELNPSVVLGPVDAAPGHDLIGLLLEDLGPPVLHDTGHAGGPFERLVIDLDDPFYAVHEPGE